MMSFVVRRIVAACFPGRLLSKCSWLLACPEKNLTTESSSRIFMGRITSFSTEHNPWQRYCVDTYSEKSLYSLEQLWNLLMITSSTKKL
jgi:hypothetical protein